MKRLQTLLLGWLLASTGTLFAADEVWMYVGTYTRGESKGIYLSRLNLKTGEATKPEVVAETSNPSFLAFHPEKKYLYAANEIGRFEGKPTGTVSAFAIDPESGQLDFLNQQISHGGAPCHLMVDETGSQVLVANYTGGNVACLPIQSSGKLKGASSVIQHEGSSVNPRRQKEPHAHSINLSPNNKFAYAADLGIDKVLIYRFDPQAGTLTPNEPAFAEVKPGGGPRHFDFHPSGKFAYVINELLSTVTAFEADKNSGALKAIQTISTLPEGYEGGNSTAEVQVDPSGKFLYGSNRGHNSIAMFAIDQETGKLTALGHQSTGGEIPRNFGIDPSGKVLVAANQKSNDLFVFRISSDGTLQRIGEKISVPSPVCVKMMFPSE